MFRRTLTALAAFIPALYAQTSSPVEQWISSRAIRLTTPEAGHGFEDMQPLRKVVGGARIVALGEATHGTREFFQLKHRMLEFLASEMGFTIFSIEASMPEAYRLNDYVLRGEGDPATLLKGMYFWTWNTEEVLDMIRWMREFNQSGKGRVEFTGFDMQHPAVAAENVRVFAAKSDPQYSSTVAAALDLIRRVPQVQNASFAPAVGTFPVESAGGKKVRFSGWIKTENVTGYAGLWWRADGPSGTLAFNNMQRLQISSTSDWKRYGFELETPANTVNINFGALLGGGGTAWFDDLQVELDGVTYENPRFDFTFESGLKGLAGGAAGYQVRVDGTTAHSGANSLLIRRTAPPPAPDAVTASKAAEAWKDVTGHLEGARPRYAEGKLPKTEVEWVIQNARVVLQTMQMRANQVSRDRSMAENVKWILDQNPQAKIVLWAHNGHVSTAGLAGAPATAAPMGATLRELFGKQMVVFGFSFAEGSFQAVTAGGGPLKNFTVPPAPQASLDAALASAKLPLFALDLRDAEKGEAAQWLDRPQRMRMIGALYPDDDPFAYIGSVVPARAFDAMLFVGKTTAAWKR